MSKKINFFLSPKKINFFWYSLFDLFVLGTRTVRYRHCKLFRTAKLLVLNTRNMTFGSSKGCFCRVSHSSMNNLSFCTHSWKWTGANRSYLPVLPGVSLQPWFSVGTRVHTFCQGATYDSSLHSCFQNDTLLAFKNTCPKTTCHRGWTHCRVCIRPHETICVFWT